MAKYKVGDKVKVVKRLYGHKFNLGDIVTIIMYNTHVEDYRCALGEKSWCLREDEISPINTISLEIDPSKPKEAHKAVSDAIEQYKQKQREWTEEEIEQAKYFARVDFETV